MPTKKGPKIRELAESLGVPPHQLLERCRAAGMPMQNTISRLTAGQATQIRAWFPDAPAADRGTDGVAGDQDEPDLGDSDVEASDSEDDPG